MSLHAPLITILLSIVVAAALPRTNGFAINRYGRRTSSISSLNALPESVVLGGPEAAQSYFFLWFFGGSGGAGVALRQFPQQLEKFQSLRLVISDEHNFAMNRISIFPNFTHVPDNTFII